VIVSILLAMSLVLMITTLFSSIDVTALAELLGGVLLVTYVVGGVVLFATRARREPVPVVPMERRANWRMPQLSLLERPTWSRARLVGMWGCGSTWCGRDPVAGQGRPTRPAPLTVRREGFAHPPWSREYLSSMCPPAPAAMLASGSGATGSRVPIGRPRSRAHPAPAPGPGGLRIAFLVYRGNPRCGGQGVYTRHLTRELVALGHSVEVFAGQPWPEVDEGVGFTQSPASTSTATRILPRPPPASSRISTRRRSPPSSSGSCARRLPEPWTFSLRARRMLAARRHEFDLVHDNQCLGYGIQG